MYTKLCKFSIIPAFWGWNSDWNSWRFLLPSFNICTLQLFCSEFCERNRHQRNTSKNSSRNSFLKSSSLSCTLIELNTIYLWSSVLGLNFSQKNGIQTERFCDFTIKCFADSNFLCSRTMASKSVPNFIVILFLSNHAKLGCFWGRNSEWNYWRFPLISASLTILTTKKL